MRNYHSRQPGKLVGPLRQRLEIWKVDRFIPKGRRFSTTQLLRQKMSDSTVNIKDVPVRRADKKELSRLFGLAKDEKLTLTGII